jgi:hypothetical protein
MISLLLPTTGRPDMAEQCVRQIRDTTDGHDVEIIAAVDADTTTRDRLTPLVDQLLYSDTYRGCSTAWNDALAASAGDPVVFAADDLTWEPGWLDEALKTLARFPDGWGLVGFNDGHWGPELSTHYLMSRKFIIDVLGGRVAWDFYPHSFNDAEVNERAKRADRYAWCETAYVRHAHWIFGDRPQDDTDRRKLDEHSAAERTFNERQAAGFPTNYPPVITC